MALSKVSGGVKSAQGDASFNKRAKYKTDGTLGMVDENTIIKEDFINAPDRLSSSEKTAWLKKWTGEYSNARPNITAVVMPIIEKFDGTIEISLFGSNLYFDPDVSYIRYKKKSNTNIWHSAVNWRVINSTQIAVIIDLRNTEVGEDYVFELKHGTFLHTTLQSVKVVERLVSKDISNLDWNDAKEEYADTLLTSKRTGNTIEHYNVSRQGSTGVNQDGKVVCIWKSDKVLSKGEEGIVVLNFDIDYETGGFEFPTTSDYFGLAEYITDERLSTATSSTFRARIGTGYQTYNNGAKRTHIVGGGALSGHQGIAMFIKKDNAITVILQTNGGVAVYSTKLLADIDLAVLLQLNGRYLSAKKVGNYTLQDVLIIN